MTLSPRSLYLSAAFVLLSTTANAACFADYKAKRPDPLQLHYGVIQLSDAECNAPARSVANRIASEGWELLTVMQVFDRPGAEERKSDAGSYYLRY